MDGTCLLRPLLLLLRSPRGSNLPRFDDSLKSRWERSDDPPVSIQINSWDNPPVSIEVSLWDNPPVRRWGSIRCPLVSILEALDSRMDDPPVSIAVNSWSNPPVSIAVSSRNNPPVSIGTPRIDPIVSMEGDISRPPMSRLAE